MLFLIALLIAFSFAFFSGKALKKYPYVFYMGAAVLTAAMAFLPSFNTHSLPEFLTGYVFGLFTRGTLATALWCVVMIAGALPNGSEPIKRLMPIRGELSIFTAILTLGHNIGYGRTYFVMFFTNSERMAANQICAAFCTIVMLAIMIPLTVISIPQVRRKMNAKFWKKLQRTAYLFYALIYVHVMLLTVPLARMGRNGYLLTVIMYSIVFLGYAFFRLRKFVLRKDRSIRKIVTNTAFIFTLLGISFVTIAAKPTTEKNVTLDHNTESYSVNAGTSSETTIHTKEAMTIVSEKAVVSDKSVSTAKNQITNAQTTEKTYVTKTLSNDTESETELVTAKAETSVRITAKSENAVVVVTEKTVKEPIQTSPPPTEPPEPEYVYNNGDFSGSAYGYDGDVIVTVSIYNDVITYISGYTNESDSFYFDAASGQVIPSIINSQSAYVDACSGATYSSNAIMQAVQNALNSARR